MRPENDVDDLYRLFAKNAGQREDARLEVPQSS